jgi:hypothetical protein
VSAINSPQYMQFAAPLWAVIFLRNSKRAQPKSQSQWVGKGQPGMADYYPILARAVSRLAINNAQARQELYEHARSVLNKYLDGSNPQKSKVDPINERIAFEMAVLKLETKSLSPHETLTDRLTVLRQHRNKPTPHNSEFGLVPDIASLLREPQAHHRRSTPIDSPCWDGIGAAPCLLYLPY